MKLDEFLYSVRNVSTSRKARHRAREGPFPVRSLRTIRIEVITASFEVANYVETND